jgi:hypothetical protein
MSDPIQKTTPVSIRLTDADRARLHRLAARRSLQLGTRVTVGEIARAAISAYLEEHAEEARP